MIAGIASALLFTSACSGGQEPANSPSQPASAPTQEAGSPTADAASLDSEYGPVIDGMPTLKELASDKNGVWRKTTILPDDPAFGVPDSVVMEPNVREMWSEEEIQEAQRLAVEMAVDAIDTPANGALGDTASMEKWWEANKDKFSPQWHDAMKTDALSTDKNDVIVYKTPHRQHSDPELDYSSMYGEDKIHIKDRKITTTEIRAGQVEATDTIQVYMEVTFFNPVILDGKEDVEGVGASMSYAFVKDEATGNLIVSGYGATFSTQPLR